MSCVIFLCVFMMSVEDVVKVICIKIGFLWCLFKECVMYVEEVMSGEVKVVVMKCENVDDGDIK